LMHRDTGVLDEFEVLCSIPALKAQRLRMRKVPKVEGLAAPGCESVVTPLHGSVTAVVDAQPMALSEKDVCYISRGVAFSVKSDEDADVLWAQAPASKEHPSYVKRFADVEPVVSGADTYRRHIYTLIGEKDLAERFIVGFVEGDSGNWTSFPPHRHDGKPEVYVYYGMGKRFGLQVVAGSEETAYLVREGDAVLFERGYHPNVATPGVGMRFAWIISAEPTERNLSVELHPDYKDMPMGQTHLTTK
jgi:5-deoxy-glucuronate isomerase